MSTILVAEPFHPPSADAFRLHAQLNIRQPPAILRKHTCYRGLPSVASDFVDAIKLVIYNQEKGLSVSCDTSACDGVNFSLEDLGLGSAHLPNQVAKFGTSRVAWVVVASTSSQVHVR